MISELRVDLIEALGVLGQQVLATVAGDDHLATLRKLAKCIARRHPLAVVTQALPVAGMRHLSVDLNLFRLRHVLGNRKLSVSLLPNNGCFVLGLDAELLRSGLSLADDDGRLSFSLDLSRLLDVFRIDDFAVLVLESYNLLQLLGGCRLNHRLL